MWINDHIIDSHARRGVFHHITSGCELIDGEPVFRSLCNFATDRRMHSVSFLARRRPDLGKDVLGADHARHRRARAITGISRVDHELGRFRQSQIVDAVVVGCD